MSYHYYHPHVFFFFTEIFGSKAQKILSFAYWKTLISVSSLKENLQVISWKMNSYVYLGGGHLGCV